MILLDTNVVSEAMRPLPDPGVLSWLDGQPIETLYLSTVSLAELAFGIAVLPDGRRKQELISACEQTMMRLFAGRILAFDADAARRFGSLMAAARTRGEGIGWPDGQIAAIAALRDMTVASRHAAPFLAVGLEVINPWVEALGARR